MQVVAAGGHRAAVALGAFDGKRLARLDGQHTAQALGCRDVLALEAHRGDRFRGILRPRLGAAQRLPVHLVQTERRQLRQHPHGVLLARGDQVDGPVEIARGQPAQRGRDQQVVRRVERGDRALHVLLGQDVDHLRGQPEHRAQAVAPGQRRADVDGDHQVHAHRPHDVDRQVVDQPAVAEDAVVDLGRREDPRHRHARPQRLRQIALAEDHRLAGLHVGGHRAKRDRQHVEARQLAHRQRVAAQQQLQPAARHRADRQHQLAGAAAEAHLQGGRDLEILLLAPLAQRLARQAVGEQGGPVERQQLALQVIGAQAAGVQAANDRAHGRAGDGVDGDVFALQHLEHAHMRQPARATAREHQADARAAQRGADLDQCRSRHGLRNHGRPRRAGQTRTEAKAQRNAEAEQQGRAWTTHGADCAARS